MNEHFIKFKRKAFVLRLVESVLLGLAFGGLLAGASLFLSNFGIWSLQPIFAVAFGVAGFLGAGACGYLILRTPSKKIAQRLDKEFGLRERVQTAIAYENKEGVIYDLQRKDADESIAKVAKKRLSLKTLWAYIACACIGLGTMASAFFIKPKIEEPPVIPDEEFAITEIQIAAMEELIVYVQNSEMQSPYKENVATALTDLLGELKQATTMPQKNEALKKAVDEIYKQTDDSSVAVELMNALWTYESSSAKQLAKTLNYYDWTKEHEWEDFSTALSDFRTSFIHADTLVENPDKEKMARETGELLIRLESGVTQSLTRVGGQETDTLCAQVKRFAVADETYGNGTHLYGFAVLGEKAETLGYEMVQKELDATFSAIAPEIFKGLKEHRANTDTGEYAMTKLKELFGYSLPRFERPNFYESTEDAPEIGDGEGNGGAGIGDGAVYGSDDLVLDPMTNKYVEYGTILERYYKLMFGKVEDGDYTEQEKEAMEKYFAILYGGFEEKGE